MSQITDGKRRSFVAGAGLTTAQYHIVKQFTDGTVVLATSGTDLSLGVLDAGVVAGDSASVTLRNGMGTSKVVLGAGGCVVGSKLTAGAGGVAVVTTTAGNEVVGIALVTGNAGDVVEILLVNRTV